MPQMQQMPINRAQQIPPIGGAGSRDSLARVLMQQRGGASTQPALGRMPDIPQLGAGGLATPPGVQQPGIGQQAGVGGMPGALPSAPANLLGGQFGGGPLTPNNLLRQGMTDGGTY
jgi:hypothetical protein